MIIDIDFVRFVTIKKRSSKVTVISPFGYLSKIPVFMLEALRFSGSDKDLSIEESMSTNSRSVDRSEVEKAFAACNPQKPEFVKLADIKVCWICLG